MPVTASTVYPVGDSTGLQRDWVGALTSPLDCTNAMLATGTARCIAWDRKTFAVARGTAADFDVAVGTGSAYGNSANAYNNKVDALFRVRATVVNNTGQALNLAPQFHVTGGQVRFDGGSGGLSAWSSTLVTAEATAEVSWFRRNGPATDFLGSRTLAVAGVFFDGDAPISAYAVRANDSGGVTSGSAFADQDFGIASATLPDFTLSQPMGAMPVGATWEIVYDLRAGAEVAGPVRGPRPQLTAFIGDPFSIPGNAGVTPAFDLQFATAVPEQATWIMLMAGMALLGARPGRRLS